MSAINRAGLRRHIIFICALLLLTPPVIVQAGILSSLGKLGKAANKADIDVPVGKLDLPQVSDDVTAVSIKPGPGGHWNVILPDGSQTNFAGLLKRRSEGSGEFALVIKGTDLPDNIRQFDKIPQDMAIYISGKNSRIYTLQRGSPGKLPDKLVYKNVSLGVDSIDSLKDGLWHLQRPVTTNPVRLMRLDRDIGRDIPGKLYTSKPVVESIGADRLVQWLHSAKNQTVVISARLQDGRLIGPGKAHAGVSIKQLREIADQNDINLVILESGRPKSLLGQLSKTMQKSQENLESLYDTTGDFFSRIANPVDGAGMKLEINASGNSQTAIHYRAESAVKTEVVDNAVASGVDMMQGLNRAVSIYRPDQERTEELERRIFYPVHTDVQLYLIISAVLGLVVIGTSWKLWCKLWFIGDRQRYRYAVTYYFLSLIHGVIFILFFIPVLGAFSFAYLVLLTIYSVIDAILIKPVMWLYRLVAG